MADREPLRFLEGLNTQLARENAELKGRLLSAGGDGTHGGVALVSYRLDQFEKRADAADARMGRVEDKLTAIQITLAGLATKDAIRNWGLAVVAIVLATGVGVGAVLLQSSGNQLAAFQAGLSAIQAITAAAQAVQQHEAPTQPQPSTKR